MSPNTSFPMIKNRIAQYWVSDEEIDIIARTKSLEFQRWDTINKNEAHLDITGTAKAWRAKPKCIAMRTTFRGIDTIFKFLYKADELNL